jgi:hypothetical protein
MATIVIYVETSVWSGWLADDAPDIQRLTRRFLDDCRRHPEVELVTSDAVLNELLQAPTNKRDRLLDLVRDFNPTNLAPNDFVDDLADAYIERRAMPKAKRGDALHAAFANVYDADFLVSWNYRHLVNERKRQIVRMVNALMGYNRSVAIVTPPEVFEDEF